MYELLFFATVMTLEMRCLASSSFELLQKVDCHWNCDEWTNRPIDRSSSKDRCEGASYGQTNGRRDARTQLIPGALVLCYSHQMNTDRRTDQPTEQLTFQRIDIYDYRHFHLKISSCVICFHLFPQKVRNKKRICSLSAHKTFLFRYVLASL